MADVHGDVSWPGVGSVESCTYTISHGISPGTAILKMHPQDTFPAVNGDLVFTDGVNGTVVIPDCKLDALKVEQDDSGTVWSLEIVDRRWKWRTLGFIDGAYNQLDPHGKLIPWTIRSPTELAVLCLQALGETNYVLNLPPGLTSAMGQGINGFLPNGLNFPPTGSNPPINWDAVPPAQALQQLADMFGCKVVYQLSSDSVLVTPNGVGDFLPPGSVHKQGPSIKSPETPDAVGVVGAPTRYQVRLKLIAVGEEWDGSYRPINLLSYAPKTQGAVQINNITVANPQAGVTWKITIDGQTIGVEAPNSAIFPSLNAIIAAINSSTLAPFQKVTASGDFTGSGKVIVTGKQQGVSFDLQVDVSPPILNPPQSISQVMVQAAQKPATSWDYSYPPLFPNVRATDRLTFEDAQRLAQKSVFRCYQLDDVDVNGGLIFIPGYGRLLRKQQIVLQDTQVDQITPQPGDPNLTDNLGRPITVNFYNGYSRDKPAVVYGQIFNYLNNNIYYKNALANANTPAGSQVFVPFTVDPTYQVITFSNYVYFQNGDKVQEPKLTLQTAVLIRNPLNNQLETFKKVVPLPGQNSNTNPQMSHHPDVQLEVTSAYDINNRLLAFTILDADPIFRANYYIQGMIAEYNASAAQIIEYNGIREIDLDGAIQQVSWNVGGDGAYTVASRNTEHSIWVPPYPARRRAEMLAPAQQVQNKNQRVSMADPPQIKAMGAGR